MPARLAQWTMEGDLLSCIVAPETGERRDQQLVFRQSDGSERTVDEETIERCRLQETYGGDLDTPVGEIQVSVHQFGGMVFPDPLALKNTLYVRWSDLPPTLRVGDAPRPGRRRTLGFWLAGHVDGRYLAEAGHRAEVEIGPSRVAFEVQR